MYFKLKTRIKEKEQITYLNYHLIVNISLKLPIVLIFLLKLLKNDNISSNDKNTLHKIIKF
jgi:hypothetical protein